MAKKRSSYKSNKAAVMERIMAKLEMGVDRSLNFITGEAIKAAPVGKKARETSRRVKGEKVTAFQDRQANTSLSLRQRHAVVRQLNAKYAGQRGSDGETIKAITGVSSSLQGVVIQGQNRSSTAAFTIRYRTGSGQEVSPLHVGAPGGKLRTSARSGGYLQGHIDRTPALQAGLRVSGKVKSGAPYSAPVEFGYAGAGRAGKSGHAEQPFMRPAKEAFKANWREIFKG